MLYFWCFMAWSLEPQFPEDVEQLLYAIPPLAELICIWYLVSDPLLATSRQLAPRRGFPLEGGARLAR